MSTFAELLCLNITNTTCCRATWRGAARAAEEGPSTPCPHTPTPTRTFYYGPNWIMFCECWMIKKNNKKGSQAPLESTARIPEGMEHEKLWELDEKIFRCMSNWGRLEVYLIWFVFYRNTIRFSYKRSLSKFSLLQIRILSRLVVATTCWGSLG